MKRFAFVVLFLVAFPTYLWAAGAPRATDFAGLLSGKVAPLSLKLKQLDAHWQRFSATGAQDQAAVYGAMYGLPAGIYYTKGQTVSVHSETYLIAYAPKIDQSGLSTLLMMGRTSEKLKAITAGTPLQLALLNVRTMGSLINIRPFSLKAELASFEQGLASFNRTMEARAASMASAEEDGSEGSASNLKNLTLAIEMYATDWDAMPPLADADKTRAVLEDYVKDNDVFSDPATNAPYQFNASLSGKNLSEIPDAAAMVVAYQAAPGEDKLREVGFADGHVKKVAPEEWDKLKAASGIKEPAALGPL